MVHMPRLPWRRNRTPPVVMSYVDEIKNEEVLCVVRQIRKSAGLPDLPTTSLTKTASTHMASFDSHAEIQGLSSSEGEPIERYKVEVQTDQNSFAGDEKSIWLSRETHEKIDFVDCTPDDIPLSYPPKLRKQMATEVIQEGSNAEENLEEEVDAEASLTINTTKASKNKKLDSPSKYSDSDSPAEQYFSLLCTPHFARTAQPPAAPASGLKDDLQDPEVAKLTINTESYKDEKLDSPSYYFSDPDTPTQQTFSLLCTPHVSCVTQQPAASVGFKKDLQDPEVSKLTVNTSGVDKQDKIHLPGNDNPDFTTSKQDFSAPCSSKISSFAAHGPMGSPGPKLTINTINAGKDKKNASPCQYNDDAATPTATQRFSVLCTPQVTCTGENSDEESDDDDDETWFTALTTRTRNAPAFFAEVMEHMVWGSDDEEDDQSRWDADTTCAYPKAMATEASTFMDQWHWDECTVPDHPAFQFASTPGRRRRMLSPVASCFDQALDNVCDPLSPRNDQKKANGGDKNKVNKKTGTDGDGKKAKPEDGYVFDDTSVTIMDQSLFEYSAFGTSPIALTPSVAPTAAASLAPTADDSPSKTKTKLDKILEALANWDDGDGSEIGNYYADTVFHQLSGDDDCDSNVDGSLFTIEESACSGEYTSYTDGDQTGTTFTDGDQTGTVFTDGEQTETTFI